MTYFQNIAIFFILFKACLLFSALVDGTWTGAAGADWTAAGSWSTTPLFPTAANDIANFTTGVSIANPTLTLNQSETVGTMNFDYSSGYSITAIPANRVITFDATTNGIINVTNQNGNGAHTLGTMITLNKNVEITQKSSGIFTISGEISESGGAKSLTLLEASTGVLRLSATTSSYTGGTFIEGGTLQIGADTNLPAASTVTMTGGVFQAGSTFTSTHPIVLNAVSPKTNTIDTLANILTVTADISGASPLIKTGTGTLVLAKGVPPNTYTGGTTINQGILSINDDGQLGMAGTPVTIGSATLRCSTTLSSSRPISLTGSAMIDTDLIVNTVTLSGIISNPSSAPHALTKINPGTLILSGANTYSGGTTISGGILSVGNDGNLGSTTGGLTIGSATLLINTAGFSSARTISLTGAAHIDTGALSPTFSGNISGTGSLNKEGTGTLILSGGANSYTAGTAINAGSIQGNTSSLQGNITFFAASPSGVIFNQSTSGTYSGILSSNAAVQGRLTLLGGGKVQITGDSHSGVKPFSGDTLISSGELNVNGNMGSSPVTISAGGILSGVGTVGATTSNGGTIRPGNSIGTIHINGNLTLNATSPVDIQIEPNGISSQVAVTGTADLSGGSLIVTPLAGFFGLTDNYTIITSAGLGGTQFSSFSSANANFVVNPSYVGSNVLLSMTVLKPFLNFPFSNSNTAAVGNAIDEINGLGVLSADFAAVIDSLAGQSFSVINSALDEMHPAQFSAFTELQNEIGGQLISLFHKHFYLPCSCDAPRRIWVEPFANELKEKNEGGETGFHALTGGIAGGFDGEIGDDWFLGIGGAWSKTHLEWYKSKGKSVINGYYGSIYTDYQVNNFYIGGAVLAGLDSYETRRHIHFTTVDRHADSSPSAIDVTAQLAMAYFFGAPEAHLYPYANIDWIYQSTSAVHEKGASSLNLDVKSRRDQTLRSELGIALEVQDYNMEQTMCVSPHVSLGWVNICPLERPNYNSSFEGTTVNFSTQGWDKTWNLFNIDFGLGINYRCFSVGFKYNIELSPDDNTTLFNQHGNIRFDWKW